MGSCSCDPTKCKQSSSLGLNGFAMRLSNIAVSMTNAMRTAGSSAVVFGTTWTTESFIEVSPACLAMSGALYLCITVFLFTTVWRTRTSDAPIWKSSPLVLLHCMSADNQLGSNKVMKESARSTSV
ncbi:hypothetical protein K469DRAFT_554810 [Zopfia rhizophila CBS 207.26]|uniref:Uncharacterized protein n=1 Tax=Zopfia rhizophila CBS 207.26 TaxID=1314779 RepID=A0A6A6EQQ1_9PEZI|nr:hypothetical protein K469DRAFT_554810 [Zopfia rhizophila CBS 207.26]